MLQILGLLVCFYVAMRGIDWAIMSKDARRVVIGSITVLGAIGFACLLIAQGAAMPDLPR